MNTTNQYESLIKSNMTTSSQSDFKTGDLYINQIIPITRRWLQSTGSILDISKAFDKVWHIDLHYKLRQNGIPDKLLNTLKGFLDNKTQSAILDSHYFSWSSLFTGAYCF